MLQLGTGYNDHCMYNSQGSKAFSVHFKQAHLFITAISCWPEGNHCRLNLFLSSL